MSIANKLEFKNLVILECLLLIGLKLKYINLQKTHKSLLKSDVICVSKEEEKQQENCRQHLVHNIAPAFF